MNAMVDIPQNKTPTAKGGDLIDIITTYKPASTQTLNKSLPQLNDIENEKRLSQRTVIIDADIITEIDDHATAGKLGLILLDNTGEPASLAYLDDNKAVVLHTAPACAFVMGDMSMDSEWWCIDGLDEAITLYGEMVRRERHVTVMACLNHWQYEKTVRHFAEKQTVHINVTHDNKATLITKLAGVNAKAVVTITTFAHLLELNQDADYLDVLSIDDTEVIDLLNEAWGEPEPLANDPSQPTPYPIEAWAGELRQAIEAIAFHAQVPTAMAGQCVLGALAHMGQRFVDAPMGHSHKPASLILVTEGESGSGKTEAMKLSHFKIKEYERQAYETYTFELDTWEAERTSLTGKELKEFMQDNPKPNNPVSVFQDATIEPILDKLINGQLINGSWATDEAGQFFNGHTMTGDTAGNALSAITTLYSDGMVSRTRSQKSNHANPKTHAYNVRLTLMLMGQRIILEPALTDATMNGQGFLARALIACPPDMRGSREWNNDKRRASKPWDDPRLQAYWVRCGHLLDPSPMNDPQHSHNAPNNAPQAGERIKMQWDSRQAETAFYEQMQDIENRQAKGGTLEHLKGYASRMAENASRIASLMAFFDDRKTITTDDIKRAFLLVEYSTAERLRYLDATPTGEQNDSEKLSEWLVKYCHKRHVKQLGYAEAQSKVSTRALRKKANFELAIEHLTSKHHIKVTDIDGCRHITLNPKLLT